MVILFCDRKTINNDQLLFMLLSNSCSYVGVNRLYYFTRSLLNNNDLETMESVQAF